MSTTSTIWMSGRVCENVLESLQPFLGIGLAGKREEDHIALAAQLLNQALAAQPSGFQIVGPDEVEPAASRCIGVHGDHRNPGLNGRVNLRLQHRNIGH